MQAKEVEKVRKQYRVYPATIERVDRLCSALGKDQGGVLDCAVELLEWLTDPANKPRPKMIPAGLADVQNTL